MDRKTKPMTNTITLEGAAATIFYEKVSRPVSRAQKRSIQESAGTYDSYRAKWKKASK